MKTIRRKVHSLIKFSLFHADAMQIILFCMAPFPSVQIVMMFIGLLARPKRFELLTPRFVLWRHAVGICQLDGFEIEAFVMSSRPGFVTKGSLPSKFRRVQVAAAKYRR